MIDKVLKDEGFGRLPRRTRAERLAADAPSLRAPASVPLTPQQCESAAGVLCLLP